MNNLKSIQKQLSDHILSPKKNKDFRIYSNKDKKWTSLKRIQIYQNAYSIRTRECLEEDFEYVYYHLGEILFQKLVKKYAQKGPSQSYTLSELGSSFPKFLKKTEINKKFPFISDLAELEWRSILSYNSSAETTQTLIFPPSDIFHMRIHHHAHFLDSYWNFLNLKKIKKNKKIIHYIIYTHNGNSYHETLSIHEKLLFKKLNKTKNLNQFIKSINKMPQIRPSYLNDFFKKWTSKNVIYAQTKEINHEITKNYS